jgi:hypothetical protein
MRCPPGTVSHDQVVPDLENKAETGRAVNKGMPSYIQVSGWRVRPGLRRPKNRGFFGHPALEKATPAPCLSKNFLGPT